MYDLQNPPVLDIRDMTQLFIDDDTIAAQVGLTRRVHQMTKIDANPVLTATEPCEGVVVTPIAVIYDEAAGQYVMWYTSYGPREGGFSCGEGFTTHRAVSVDGIAWRKPNLGNYEPNVDASNICTFEDGLPVQNTCAVFFDPDDEPDKRYKLLDYRPNYYLSYSADGIHWRSAQDEPVWLNGAGDGLEETYFFSRDPLTNRYRAYMRVWKRQQTIRTTSLGESDDLTTWTGPTIVWDAEPTFGIGAQLYGMTVYPDGGVYWGLPWIFYNDLPLDADIQQTMRFRLGWSTDGWTWNALAPEQDAVPFGKQGEFDAGMMLSSCPPVMMEDRVRMYYFGIDRKHDSITSSQAGVGIAEIRRCGFVSMRAGDDEGALLTHRFLFRGESLHINACVEPGGYVQAELLDDRGHFVAGRTLKESDRFTGDAVDHPLTWNGQSNLSDLFGQRVMLRLRFRKADVYAFQAAGPEERFTAPLGPPPVLCGLCTKPPIIDGRLDDNCWQDFSHSGVADNFVAFDRNVQADYRTRLLFTRDDDHLYIAAECDEPDATRDANDLADDMIEIRLSAPGQGAWFNQLMVHADGRRTHCWFSVEDGGARQLEQVLWDAKTSTAAGRWCAELVVPFACLQVEPPQTGDAWELNVIRHRRAAGQLEMTSWSCLFSSVHRNDRSGQMTMT